MVDSVLFCVLGHLPNYAVDGGKKEYIKVSFQEMPTVVKKKGDSKKNITYDGVVETIKRISERIPVFIVSNCQSGYIEVVMEEGD